MKPEAYFLIYAFPAISSCGRIEPERVRELEKMAIRGEAPSEKELKKIFPRAYERIKRLTGKEHGYTIDDYRLYWWIEHNRIIEAGEHGYENATPEAKIECMIRFPHIIRTEGNIVTLTLNGADTINGNNYRELPLQSNQMVSIHKRHVIEIIGENFYQNFMKEYTK